VFAYLIGNTGETLDAKRFVISENDLPTMAALFKQFQGNPAEFHTSDPRCKVFPIKRFKPEEHWMVNKWWSIEERERLGDVEAECFVGSGELSALLKDAYGAIDKQATIMVNMERKIEIKRTVTLLLSDARYFHMKIGKRVLKKDLRRAGGTVPLYSANVEVGKEHGWIKESKITDFSHPSLLWSIDSDFNITVRNAGEVFDTTDHCGKLEICDSGLDPAYCQAAIVYGYGRTYGFDRVMRPSIKRMKKVTLRIPVKTDGTFDLEAQCDLAREFVAIQEAVRVASESLEAIKDLKPRADLPKDAEDLGFQPGRIAQPHHRRVSKQDRLDSKIATERLKQLKADSERLISGTELDEKLNELLA
jgi:hypothetical protein